MLPNCPTCSEIRTFHIMFTGGNYEKTRKLKMLFKLLGFELKEQIFWENITIHTVAEQDLIELVKIMASQPVICCMPADHSKLPAVMKIYYQAMSDHLTVDKSTNLSCTTNFTARDKKKAISLFNQQIPVIF